jgi:hypothetical protein
MQLLSGQSQLRQRGHSGVGTIGGGDNRLLHLAEAPFEGRQVGAGLFGGVTEFGQRLD